MVSLILAATNLTISQSDIQWGTCGDFTYKRLFEVTPDGKEKFSEDGWIIQQIRAAVTVASCDGEVIITDLFEYLEAFRVIRGRVVRFPDGFIDTWHNPDFGICTKGQAAVSGSAFYYNSDIVGTPNIRWPWRRDGDHPSRGAPYIPIPGPSPSGLDRMNSNRLFDYFTATWNCCSGKKERTK